MFEVVFVLPDAEPEVITQVWSDEDAWLCGWRICNETERPTAYRYAGSTTLVETFVKTVPVLTN